MRNPFQQRTGSEQSRSPSEPLERVVPKSSSSDVGGSTFISLYSKVNKPGEQETITLQDFIEIIKSDFYKKVCEKVRSLDDKDKRQKIKIALLPAVCIQGVFNYRKNDALKEASGFSVIDFDTYNEDVEKIKEKLREDNHVYSAFVSPSGGLKAIIRIPKVKNDEEYKQVYEQLLAHYSTFNPSVDISNKDISRLCYFSYDPDIYVNDEVQEFKVVKGYENKTIQESKPKEKVKKDNSRSAREYGHCMRLISRGHDKKSVFEQMNDFTKWSTSSPQYRELTYKNALLAVKQHESPTKEQTPQMQTYAKHTLEEVKEVIMKWLEIKDTEVIDVIFAFSIAEQLPGDPLWLFLIAPPGGCKTEILRAINGEYFYHLSDLSSKTFVSGLMLGQGENRRKIDDLLPQLNKKVLLFKDFTTILEKDKDERRQIIAQLREIYDGSFAKKFGTIDKKIEYYSRFGLIAGVTPIIDKHWKIMQQLGERFLKYRWEENNLTTTRRAQKNEGKEKIMRKEIKEAVMGYLTNLEIKDPPFPEEYVEVLIKLANFVAICRTPVTLQNNRGEFNFDYIPVTERPTRLVKQLKKFCKVVACVRKHITIQREDILTAMHIAFHTCPQDRLTILRGLEKQQELHDDGCTVWELRKVVDMPRTSIGYVLEQLEILKLVELTVDTKEIGGVKTTKHYYKLTKNTPALYPPSFMGATINGGVDSARVQKMPLVEAVKQTDKGEGADIEQVQALMGCNDKDFVRYLHYALKRGDVHTIRPGLIKVLE